MMTRPLAVLLFLLGTFPAAASGAGTPTNSPPATSAAAPAPEARVEVRGYQVVGNTLLRPRRPAAPGGIALVPAEFEVLTNYTGMVPLSRVREAVGALQLVYRERGFPTVSVSLPQQKLTNGIVMLQVVEGRLVDILIKGNHYYNTANIRRALPSLTTNLFLNTKWFQPELDRANANADRQIYPELAAGPDPGTTALTLKVKDRLPLHGHMELNDKATTDTPLLRLDTAVQYNNLWQLDHQIGFDYNFSPQAFKSDAHPAAVYDAPKVANYSGFYRLPLGGGGGLRDTYDHLPADFGYDEISHRFNLPPPTGVPEFSFYASRSASETPLQYGPVTLVTNTALADISSQFVQQNRIAAENVGTKFTLPLREFAGVRSTAFLGLDFKTYSAHGYVTNLTYFDLYSLDNYGNRVLVTNEVIALGAVNTHSLNYLPLSLGWTGSRPDPHGATSLYLNSTLFLEPLASDRSDFVAVAGTPAAGATTTAWSAGLIREQKLPHEWTAQWRANGQWAGGPLINNEQFALGGSAGVRGYAEGRAYGDSGWRTLLDLRTPPTPIGTFPVGKERIPAVVRGAWFMDYGQIHDYARSAGAPEGYAQWGSGVSCFITSGQHFEARMTLAWALLNTPDTRAGSARAYFNLGWQF